MLNKIYTLHGPKPYFDSKEETSTKEETPAVKAEKEFNENAEKLAKEHGLIPKDKEEKSEKEEKAETTAEESESGESEDSSEAGEEELDEEKLAQAKTIFRLLNDPKTALAALDTLARTAGFTLSEIKEASKEEKKEIAKSIEEVVEERLGTKIPFLSKELGAVLKEVITSAVEEKTKDLRESVNKEIASRREAEIKSSFEKVVSSYNGVTEAVLKEIVRIQEAGELIPGKMEPEKYFKSCIILAADNLGVSLTRKSANGTSRPSTQETKRPDALASLAAAKRGSESKEGLSAARVTTINEAVEAAAKSIDAKFAEK